MREATMQQARMHPIHVPCAFMRVRACACAHARTQACTSAARMHSHTDTHTEVCVGVRLCGCVGMWV